MGLFKPNYEKEGPGVEKDAPPKTGFALFFDILSLQFWQLIKLNLLFVVCCIPVVTIGPACAGMTYALLRFVRREPDADVWYDFRRGFRENWKAGLGCGIAMAAIFGVLGTMMVQCMLRGMTILAAVPLALTLIAGVSAVYLFPMLVSVDLPVRATVNNAFLLGMICVKRSLPVFVLAFVLVLAEALFFPLTVPIVLFIGAVLPCFITTFVAWGGIRQHILKEIA